MNQVVEAERQFAALCSTSKGCLDSQFDLIELRSNWCFIENTNRMTACLDTQDLPK